ncbi:hypothetical protein FQR65_LT08326 [Abscondita terminalis]|nr:hypothetical protein FQR65_LT08326 [Abscondita terminalis]
MFYKIVFIWFVAAGVSSNDLEKYLSLCKRQRLTRDTCMQNFLNSRQPLANQGIDDFGIPALGPFEIPKLNISQDGEGMSVSAQLYNFALHNLSHYHVLNLEQGNGKVTLQAVFPNVILTAFYEIDGTLSSQLFKGRGFLQVNFTPIHMNGTIHYNTFSKSNEKQCKILKVDVKVNVDDVSLKVEGLHKDNEYLSGCEKQKLSRNICMENYMNRIQPRASKGLEELGLPPLGPFELPKLTVAQTGENLTLFMNLFNFALHNFSNYHALNWEQGDEKVAGGAVFEDVILTAFYNLDGTFFSRPLKGRGFVEIIFSPIFLNITIYYNTFHKSTKKHCKILEVNANAKIDDLFVNFEGLSQDSVQNEFLNFHSRFVASRAAKGIEKMFEVYLKKQFEDLCRNNPFFITKTMFI